MRTVGVIGGLGPQATMDFEARVHRVCQRLVPQSYNFGYPPMHVAYVRRPPFLLDEEGRPRVPWQPDPALLEAARWLGGACDFLVIASNGTHVFQSKIEQASGRPVLSMVKLAIDHVSALGWQSVGVLGYGEPVVYTSPFVELGIACETVGGDIRDRLDKEIISVWEGRETKESTNVARFAVDALRKRSVGGIVLGCTELPILLGERAGATDLVDPLELLAEATVREAMAGP